MITSAPFTLDVENVSVPCFYYANDRNVGFNGSIISVFTYKDGINNSWGGRDEIFDYITKKNFVLRLCGINNYYYKYWANIIDMYWMMKETRYHYKDFTMKFYPSYFYFEKIVTVSSKPEQEIIKVSQLLETDGNTVFLLVVSIFIISCCLSLRKSVHLYLDNTKQRRPNIPNVISKIFTNSFDSVWNLISTLFYEAYPRKKQGKPFEEIILAVWLLASTVILSYVGATMRGQFSEIKYITLDKFTDIFDGTGPKLQGYFNKRSLEDAFYRQWVEKYPLHKGVAAATQIPTNTKCIVKLLNEDRGAYIVSEMFFKMNLNSFPTTNKWFYSKSVHVKQEPPYSEFRYMPLSSLMNDTTKIELLRKVVLFNTEHQFFRWTTPESKALLDLVTWKKPEPKVKSLNLSTVSLPFEFWLKGLVVSCVVVALEILSACMIQRKEKKKINPSTLND